MHPLPFLLSLVGSPKLSIEVSSGMVLSINVRATVSGRKLACRREGHLHD